MRDNPPSVSDAIAGGLLGVAAGDALGAPVEFMSPEEIRSQHGVHREITGGGRLRWRVGQGTDDTDLTWAAGNPPDIGVTTRNALRNLKQHGDPTTSGLTDEHYCGNGSLMRAIPTGLVRSDAVVRRCTGLCRA